MAVTLGTGAKLTSQGDIFEDRFGAQQRPEAGGAAKDLEIPLLVACDKAAEPQLSVAEARAPSSLSHDPPPRPVLAEQAGVGLLLAEMENSNLISVKQVVPRGSADRSGRVRVGDHILRVAGIDATTGMGVTDLRNLIVGEQGTRVSILFRLVSASVSAWLISPKS